MRRRSLALAVPHASRGSLLLALTASVVACGGTPSGDDAGTPTDAFVPPDGVRCVDITTVEACEGGHCTSTTCRGDEVCQAAACVPWTDASLSCDFTITDLGGRQVAVQVTPDGFPRSQTESVRFTFGDGVAGQGEGLVHRYDEAGVYPIELEVRLRGHRFLRASRLAVIDGASSAHQPLRFTVNGIPERLNGSVPFTRDAGTPDDPSDDVTESFHLLVPRTGFTLDLTVVDDPNDPIDLDTLTLTADAALGDRAAGAPLAGLLDFTHAENQRVPAGSYRLGPDDAVPAGMVTFTVGAEATSGTHHEATLSVEAVELTPERDPFDREMVWLFLLDRDFFTTTPSRVGTSRFTLDSVAGANGRPDLLEELTLIGAQGGVEASLDAAFLRWVLDSIRKETLRYFGVDEGGAPTDGIPLRIVWQGDPGAPDPATFDAAGTFSMMRFGGAFPDAVGYSDYAAFNEERVDDGRADRGIASGALISTLMDTPVISAAFDPIKPGLGAPIGSDASDATVLDPAFDPYAEHPTDVATRYAALHRIARYLGLILASVTAHEMGHAMGLMPDGPPPLGFFGGERDVDIVGSQLTNSHHADLPGLNLMQAGGNFNAVIESALGTVELPATSDLLLLAEAVALENRLSPYSRAYLQRRLTYAAF